MIEATGADHIINKPGAVFPGVNFIAFFIEFAKADRKVGF